jgi:acyl carrier protein
MTKDDKTFELYILEKAINTYLDETFSVTEEALNSLVSKRDEIVWKIAKEIYSQSGHKVEFSVVRNVVNSRIEVLKMHIATEKSIAYERLQSQKVEEARQAAEETQRIAEAENRKQNRLTELAKKLDESGRDKRMSHLFLKVQNIVSEQLSVELDAVTLKSHILNDLGADALDVIELAMALEEEFDIEIPEDILGDGRSHNWWFSSCSNDSNPVACSVGELLDFIHKQVSP